MRRKDREVTDLNKICEILDHCDCCRVGFCDEGQVYIVPLNFGYTQENGRFTFYFHGAKEGRKINLIQKAPNVGFELDTNYKLNEGAEACDYSARFQSVIGNGVISMIDDMEEKKRGLNILMKHATGKDDWTFDENMMKVVSVFKIEADTLSCKEHL